MENLRNLRKNKKILTPEKKLDILFQSTKPPKFADEITYNGVKWRIGLFNDNLKQRLAKHGIPSKEELGFYNRCSWFEQSMKDLRYLKKNKT